MKKLLSLFMCILLLSSLNLMVSAGEQPDKSMPLNPKGKVLVKAKSATSVKKSNKTETKIDVPATSQAILDQVNAEREAVGVAPLVIDETLTKIAGIRIAELPQNYSHTRPDNTSWKTALEAEGIKNVYIGENIASGYKTTSEAMAGWMNSSGHKTNILSDRYTKIGIGHIVVDEKHYWIQVFSA